MSKHVRLGPLLEVEMWKKCTPLWREAHLEVKSGKTRQLRTTFGRCSVEKVHAVVARSTFCEKMLKLPHARATFGRSDLEKVHAVVARSTFGSKKCQSTLGSDDFWKLRCGKNARGCGAKHISKSTCTKHTNIGPLLEVEISKKCTLLWREAHIQVKSVKNCWF